MSGDLQQEKKDHQKEEHEEIAELEGPAIPGRVLTINEPPPPNDVELPGPGDDTGGNDLLATIEPATVDVPDAASADGGSADRGGSGGGGGGAGGGAGPSID
jgi:hypothetical protein